MRGVHNAHSVFCLKDMYAMILSHCSIELCNKKRPLIIINLKWRK